MKLAEKQLKMKARQAKNLRPGRKVGQLSEATLKLAEVRYFTWTLLRQGISLEQTAAQVTRLYGFKPDLQRMRKWVQSGCPLVNKNQCAVGQRDSESTP
jgi:hypothetical protein